jgi:hypothetical protein
MSRGSIHFNSSQHPSKIPPTYSFKIQAMFKVGSSADVFSIRRVNDHTTLARRGVPSRNVGPGVGQGWNPGPDHLILDALQAATVPHNHDLILLACIIFSIEHWSRETGAFRV